MRPHWEGEELFQGDIIHSRVYKNPKPFIGKNVLVVGMGNTGAEIALDLAEAGIPTRISVRSPVNIVPRDLLGRPVQTSAKMLARPSRLGDVIGAQIRRVFLATCGSTHSLSDVPPMVQVRTTGKTPVIDLERWRKSKPEILRW
ncbi:MAG: hypothetical protein R3B47_16285 [Bacteroidia bacterium]